jgi:hypothetical protein
MKPLKRTLAILACLLLVVQTARHAYVLWLEPRHSVLDQYDQPLKADITAAASLDELQRRYEPAGSSGPRRFTRSGSIGRWDYSSLCSAWHPICGASVGLESRC